MTDPAIADCVLVLVTLPVDEDPAAFNRAVLDFLDRRG